VDRVGKTVHNGILRLFVPCVTLCVHVERRVLGVELLHSLRESGLIKGDISILLPKRLLVIKVRDLGSIRVVFLDIGRKGIRKVSRGPRGLKRGR